VGHSSSSPGGQRVVFLGKYRKIKHRFGLAKERGNGREESRGGGGGGEERRGE